MEQVAGASFGRYEVIRPIGEGGMAQIYLGVRRGVGGFEKRVVLKVLQAKFVGEQEYVDMFLEEARLLARLNHPNIVDVYEVDCIDGVPFLAMEYVNGPTIGHLHRRAVRAGNNNIGFFLHLMQQVCQGLHFAHKLVIDGASTGLVHRDVSSQNIVVAGATGVAKLIDFGIAKSDDQSSKTQVGILKGKLHYMAPEVLQGHKPDARADLYSAGVLLYRLATDHMPFKDGEDLWAGRIAGRYQPPSMHVPDLPEAVSEIIAKALQPDPAERYQTAAELGADLQKVTDRMGVDSPQIMTWIDRLFPEGEDEWQRRFGAVGTASTMHSSLGRLIADEERSKVSNHKDARRMGAAMGAVAAFGGMTLVVALVLVGVLFYRPNPPDATPTTEVDVILDAADDMIGEGKFEPALEMNQRAAAAGVQDASVIVRITRQRSDIERKMALMQARSQIQTGQRDAARATLSRALEKNPSDREILEMFHEIGVTAPVVAPAPGAEPEAAPAPVVAAAPQTTAREAAPDPKPTAATRPPETPAPVEPARPTEALVGDLFVSTTPPALVYVDDGLVGQSPMTLRGLSAGQHSVVVTLEGYVQQRVPVTIQSGQAESVELTLARAWVAPEPEVAAAPVPVAPAPKAAVPEVDLPARKSVETQYEFRELAAKIQVALDESGVDPALSKSVLADLEVAAGPKFEAGQSMSVDPRSLYQSILDQSRLGLPKKDVITNVRRAWRAGSFE